jgi:hypothetical protein
MHFSVAGVQGGGLACGIMAVSHKSIIPCYQKKKTEFCFDTKSFTLFGSNDGRGDDPEVLGRAYFELNL